MTQRNSILIPSFLGHPDKILPPLFLISTCIKILLIPTYRSTDFDVHRNWLAITHNTPISEWYWNDVNGTTVHTLDYPPAFAFFESFLSNNFITELVLPQGDKCLDLLPDFDNTPSQSCIVFQRSTVIFSDIILWIGAYFACRSLHPRRPLQFVVTSFLLIVFNPALLWLDHIHFQYNGMILGVLLASLGCLMMGNNVAIVPENGNHTVKQPIAYDIYHLAGAGLFALLLNLKHLYLPLAPLYFCYLLERYCLTNGIPAGGKQKQFLPGKFLQLALVTGTTLVLPWIPFIMCEDPKSQILQILKRLFPFQRGLVHDYWAGNIWALYTFANRVLIFAVGRLGPKVRPMLSEEVADILDGMYLPEPSPLICAVLLCLSIIPGLQMASSRLTNKKLIEAVVYVSLCSFMLAYHVHEKAILTTMIPLTLLVEPNPRGEYYNLLFWNITLWGLLGLFPLLYRTRELSIKLSSFLCYLGLISCLLRTPPRWIMDMQYRTYGLVALVIAFLEIIPIQGKWEFFPLMTTSIVCASGLVTCWTFSFWLLMRDENKPSVES